MKFYTNLEQSRKLAEILPVESADMFFADGERPAIWNNKDAGLDDEDIPCWSLAALMNIMRLDYYIVRTLDILTSSFTYSIHAGYFDIETGEYENLVDACVEMISKLHEQKLL